MESKPETAKSPAQQLPVPHPPGPCQLCGTKPLDRFDIPDSTTLWHCQRCDLYQYGRMADSSAYRTEYHAGYTKHRDQKVHTAMARLNRAATYVTGDRPRVLDIGSSVGCTLEAAAKRGWEVIGVDVSEDAVDFCQQRGLDCRLVNEFDLPFEDSTFDLVVSWHVIEHVEDVRQTLREWRRVIKPGGVLFFETPNGQCRKVRRLKERYRKFWAPEHTYTFSPDSLARFVEQAGFELMETPTLGPLGGFGIRHAARICAYQTYQGLRAVAGVNKAFQICARRANLRVDEPMLIPAAA